MKTINETFTDAEFVELVKAKNKLNWHDFIMMLVKGRFKNGRTKREKGVNDGKTNV